ncbi:MAG: class I SAM-dependent methyltransferase [Oligoflexales bacterium]|nr:class I SAM-dependent methyltransferase [Oligoflexales bacterium]
MYLWRRPLSTWRGLTARAAPGTHEGVVEVLLKNKVPSTHGPQLDLACGTGALIARLKDHGFSKIEGADLNPEQCGLSDLKPRQVSFDKPFAQEFYPTCYELITAVEIIEHLENPWQFLREIKQLLTTDGFALISTPNVGHWLSRMQFLRSGQLKYFSTFDFHEQRHITPIFDHHMRLMLEEIGFELVDFKCTGTSWGLLIKILTAPLAFVFWLLNKEMTQGNVNIYLLKKRV